MIFFPLLIYVLHHVLLLQINTSQMICLFTCRGCNFGERARSVQELRCFMMQQPLIKTVQSFIGYRCKIQSATLVIKCFKHCHELQTPDSNSVINAGWWKGRNVWIIMIQARSADAAGSQTQMNRRHFQHSCFGVSAHFLLFTAV